MVIGIEESYCDEDVETGTGFSTRAAVSESEGNSLSIKNNVTLVSQCTIIHVLS